MNETNCFEIHLILINYSYICEKSKLMTGQRRNSGSLENVDHLHFNGLYVTEK